MTFQKGQSGNPAGKKPGTQNRLPIAIKAAIEGAFQAVGGQDYLVELARTDKAVFCALLGKVLPSEHQHSGGISMLHSVDRPAPEPREVWLGRRNTELLALAPPAGSAE